MDLTGKTFLVTGASGGIGSEVCRLLSEEKARVILSGRDNSSLLKLKNEIGDEHIPLVADISTEGGRKILLDGCDSIGVLDGVINLAGVLDFDLFEGQSSSNIERMITINFTSLVLLCHELIPRLRGSTDTVLVNVGSTFGSIGFPGFVAYCASKAGVRCFTEALARELADSNISVCYVAPRATATKFNSSEVVDLNKALGNQADSVGVVAEGIVRAIKFKKRQTFIGWPEKIFVKVNTLMPSILDKFLYKKLPIIKKHSKRE